MYNQGPSNIPGAIEHHDIFDPNEDEVLDGDAFYGWYDNGMLGDQDLADYFPDDEDSPQDVSEQKQPSVQDDASSYKSVLTANLLTPKNVPRSNVYDNTLPVESTEKTKVRMTTRPRVGLFDDTSSAHASEKPSKVKARKYLKNLYDQLIKHSRSLRNL